jgi:hypothetical protein
MIDILQIEEETSSMTLTVAQVLPRDFAATEELFQTFANLLHAYAGFLNRGTDLTAEQENAFQEEYERTLAFLQESMRNFHALKDN